MAIGGRVIWRGEYPFDVPLFEEFSCSFSDELRSVVAADFLMDAKMAYNIFLYNGDDLLLTYLSVCTCFHHLEK